MKRLVPMMLLLLAACGDGATTTEKREPPLEGVVQRAAALYPDAITLHTKVVTRSCSPTGGVCHNSKEYPDLHTISNLIASLSMPCNLDKTDEPEAMFDGCEPAADVLTLPGVPGFEARIASISEDRYDEETFRAWRDVVLDTPLPSALTDAQARFTRDGRELVLLTRAVEAAAGTKVLSIDLSNVEYPTYLELGRVRGGDPNGNGVFGGEDPWNVVAPGDVDRSYLLGRILGTVPGSKMPLANQGLSAEELIALSCWIETLGAAPSATDPIRYQDCVSAERFIP